MKRKTGEVVLIDENRLPVPDHKQNVKIPYQVQKLFGCLDCEWRGTPMCPEGFKSGRIGKIHEKGVYKNVCVYPPQRDHGGYGRKVVVRKLGNTDLYICKKRRDYLKILSPDKGVQSVSAWLKHYNMMQQQIINNQDHQRLRFHIDKLISLENKKHELEEQGSKLSKEDTEILKELELKTWKVRNDYLNTWKELMTFQDKQVDRDTPKKIEHEVKHVSMRDIMKQVSDYKEGEVVDADYEVLEDE